LEFVAALSGVGDRGCDLVFFVPVVCGFQEQKK